VGTGDVPLQGLRRSLAHSLALHCFLPNSKYKSVDADNNDQRSINHTKEAVMAAAAVSTL
jgi:hypothetical protein